MKQSKFILNRARDEADKIGRNSLSQDNKFVIMVEAGSKGSNINISQMISCLGQQNVDNKRIPYGFENRTLPHFKKYDDTPEARGFIESSFIEGLTPQEMYFHAMGGRTGLIDTAVKTSGTGYIQRRLVKGLEDLKLHYDMTVRNNKNKIIQFSYGDDNINPCKIENQGLPITSMSEEDIYLHYKIPDDDINKIVYSKPALKRFRNKDQKSLMKKITKEKIEFMLKSKEDLLNHVFKYTDKDVVHIPVNFKRLIDNVRYSKVTTKSISNITPVEFII